MTPEPFVPTWPRWLPWFGWCVVPCEEDGTPTGYWTHWVIDGLTFEWFGWCLLIYGHIYTHE